MPTINYTNITTEKRDIKKAEFFKTKDRYRNFETAINLLKPGDVFELGKTQPNDKLKSGLYLVKEKFQNNFINVQRMCTDKDTYSRYEGIVNADMVHPEYCDKWGSLNIIV